MDNSLARISWKLQLIGAREAERAKEPGLHGHNRRRELDLNKKNLKKGGGGGGGGREREIKKRV